MKKAEYRELNRHNIVNGHGELIGQEYDVFFDQTFIGTVKGNKYGLYGENTGMFRECSTAFPLAEIAHKMGVELVNKEGKPFIAIYL